MNKQIEEMAKYRCFPCEMEYNGECLENRNPCKCYTALDTAEALYNAGYRKQDEVARKIFAELKTVMMDEYRYPIIAELKKEYGVEKDEQAN